MSSKSGELPLILRIHNATCPIWLLRITPLQKLEPGCQAVLKRLGGQRG